MSWTKEFDACTFVGHNLTTFISKDEHTTIKGDHYQYEANAEVFFQMGLSDVCSESCNRHGSRLEGSGAVSDGGPGELHCPVFIAGARQAARP
jgi:hypothetical protein